MVWQARDCGAPSGSVARAQMWSRGWSEPDIGDLRMREKGVALGVCIVGKAEGEGQLA